MTTDFRALCAELHAAFTTYAVDECHHNLLERTRAALADGPSSVVSEPSDEEIMELWHGSDWYNEGATLREFLSITRAVLARWGNPAPQPPAPVTENPTDEDLLNLHDWMTDEWAANHEFELPPSQYARAVLTCWGRPESVPNPWKDTLLDALVCNFLLNSENKDDPKKALSDLIAWEKQLATDPLINPALQPVPISERLPEPKDCDAEHYCWRWNTIGGLWARQPLARRWYEFESHWLPAYALPLPDTND